MAAPNSITDLVRSFVDGATKGHKAPVIVFGDGLYTVTQNQYNLIGYRFSSRFFFVNAYNLYNRGERTVKNILIQQLSFRNIEYRKVELKNPWHLGECPTANNITDILEAVATLNNYQKTIEKQTGYDAVRVRVSALRWLLHGSRIRIKQKDNSLLGVDIFRLKFQSNDTDQDKRALIKEYNEFKIKHVHINRTMQLLKTLVR